MLLKACLNGAHPPGAHPSLPTTPDELARHAAAVVTAGAGAVHVHPRRADGVEALDGDTVGATVAAIRAVAPVPVGVTTGSCILPEPHDRLEAIAGWTETPDFASVNLHEHGAVEVAWALLDRGIGVEAGVWHRQAAEILVESGLALRCLRVLVEPMDATAEEALVTVDEIDEVLAGDVPDVPRLLHGIGPTVWPLLDEAGRRGWQSRIGMEDTHVLPDGSPAPDNAALVVAGRQRLDEARDRADSSS
jgi:uncharacterized protein (DUF849 family)